MKVARIFPALILFSFMGWLIAQANIGNSNIFFELVHSIPFGDKLGHFILYGTLSLLTIIAFNYKYVSINGYRIPYGAFIVLLLAIAEEVTQLFVSNRTFDTVDLLADISGIIIFMLVLNKFRSSNCFNQMVEESSN
jgi:hypothetical protein